MKKQTKNPLKILSYQTPINLSYYWNFGSIAAYVLVVQIVSGFMMALWYIPNVDDAFNSIEYVMREVDYGWMYRYIHSNGASIFFAVVYIHMARALYYGSYIYPRQKVWYSGFIIFMLMVVTAFFGYVLPWGQMSYWAATVISSLVSTLPVFGNDILTFLWGGISVDQPTLTRIFGLHFILPFVIVGLVIIHLVLLHEHRSNNPKGLNSFDNASFQPYFTIKDAIGIWIVNVVFIILVCFYPNALSHPDNYIPANPEVTPLHIVPEWYFLPFYAILRSVPDKAGGILLLAFALALLAFLPYISQPVVRSGEHRIVFQHLYWFFIANCLLLGWSGGNPVAYPYLEICRVTTALYFLFYPLNYGVILYERSGRGLRF